METPNVTDILAEADMAISHELLKLKTLLPLLAFEVIEEFTITEKMTAICGPGHAYPGIYFFEIKNRNLDTDVSVWMQEFGEAWRHPDYHMQWVPGLKKGRIKKHLSIGEWVPLYIGKSKNVGGRINEHILKELTKTTFAMKLKARRNLYGTAFRVSSLKIDVKNYDVIAPYLENLLRNHWNPIVGKQ